MVFGVGGNFLIAGHDAENPNHPSLSPDPSDLNKAYPARRCSLAESVTNSVQSGAEFLNMKFSGQHAAPRIRYTQTSANATTDKVPERRLLTLPMRTFLASATNLHSARVSW
jgi:hypothetical protein